MAESDVGWETRPGEGSGAGVHAAKTGAARAGGVRGQRPLATRAAQSGAGWAARTIDGGYGGEAGGTSASGGGGGDHDQSGGGGRGLGAGGGDVGGGCEGGGLEGGGCHGGRGGGSDGGRPGGAGGQVGGAGGQVGGDGGGVEGDGGRSGSAPEPEPSSPLEPEASSAKRRASMLRYSRPPSPPSSIP